MVYFLANHSKVKQLWSDLPIVPLWRETTYSNAKWNSFFSQYKVVWHQCKVVVEIHTFVILLGVLGRGICLFFQKHIASLLRSWVSLWVIWEQVYGHNCQRRQNRWQSYLWSFLSYIRPFWWSIIHHVTLTFCCWGRPEMTHLGRGLTFLGPRSLG